MWLHLPEKEGDRPVNLVASQLVQGQMTRNSTRAVGFHGTRAPQFNECMGNISLNLEKT